MNFSDGDQGPDKQFGDMTGNSGDTIRNQEILVMSPNCHQGELWLLSPELEGLFEIGPERRIRLLL